MNTPDPLTELRNYVGGQVVASEKAIAMINQLHEERERYRNALEKIEELSRMTITVPMFCSSVISLAREGLKLK